MGKNAIDGYHFLTNKDAAMKNLDQHRVFKWKNGGGGGSKMITR